MRSKTLAALAAVMLGVTAVLSCPIHGDLPTPGCNICRRAATS